jgi:hypothetical protein
MADGQLALNTNNTSPGLFFKDSNGALVKVGPVHVGSTAPNASPAAGGSTGNAIGEQWLDTAGGTYVFKVWDGSAWRSESGTFVDVNGDVMTGALVMDNQQQVRFRETTANGTNFIAIQAPASVSADRTLTLPDVTGTLVSTGDTGSVTSTMIADGTIVNADINASAAIAGTKISPDFGSQNVTTTGTSTSASFTPTSSAVPTNGVYLPAANSVAISTGGSGRLFVDASGRVGVGVSSLDDIAAGYATLQIGGTNGGGVRVGTSSAVVGYMAGSASGVEIGTTGTTALNFFTNNQTRATITSAGLVGVGTSSPSDPLHIAVSGANSANIRLQSGDGRTYNIGSTGSGYGSSGKFIIYDITAGAERFCINSSGNVGVGTTSPAVALDVRAAGTGDKVYVFNGSDLSTGLVLGNGSDHAYLDTGTQARLAFKTNGTEKARIDSLGRVGIGVSSPQQSIDTSGNIRLSSGGSRVMDLLQSVQAAAYTGPGFYSSSSIGYGVASGGTHRWIGIDGNTEIMRLDSSGRLGIGTTSPVFGVGDGVEVARSGVATVRVSSNTQGVELRSNNGTGTLETRAAYPLVFGTSGTERARIDSSGRLLVGTSSSPNAGLGQYALAVVQGYAGGTTGEGILSIARGKAATAMVNTDTVGQIAFTDNAGNTFAKILSFVDGTVSSTSDLPGALSFSTTADGASSPTERLYLYSNGYVRAPGVYALTTAVAADVRVDSDGYLYRSTSSIRYKKDVETLQDEYADAILNARPVWFRSLSEKDNPDWGYWGFIAEEVEQIDPRLCTYGEDEEGNQRVESVQYDRFVPHLLNLIKRQQQAIETLEAKVAALESV